jgi:nucleoside-diphosphate-sugar epimerase
VRELRPDEEDNVGAGPPTRRTADSGTCVTNLYGPWIPQPAPSHVVAALVRKFVEAKRAKPRTAVGHGHAGARVPYVEDCADAILEAGRPPDLRTR